jgi:hypothetical protein
MKEQIMNVLRARLGNDYFLTHCPKFQCYKAEQWILAGLIYINEEITEELKPIILN